MAYAFGNQTHARHSFVESGAELSKWRVESSSDTVQWRQEFEFETPKDARSPRLRFAGNRFFVLGPEGLLMSSSDAKRWAMLDLGTRGHLFDIAFGNGRWVVSSGNSGDLFRSTDGTTWEKTSTYPQIWSLAWGGGVFVGTDSFSRGGNLRIHLSEDGETWAELHVKSASLPDAPNTIPMDPSGIGIAHGHGIYQHGTFVVSGSNGEIWQFGSPVKINPTPPPSTPRPTPQPDTQGPSIRIEHRRISTGRNTRMFLRGTAEDNGEVARVEYRMPGKSWTAAAGTRRWKIMSNLERRWNPIKIRARDTAGNLSRVIEISVKRK